MIKQDPSIKGILNDVRNRLEADLHNLHLKWKDAGDEDAKIKLLERMIVLRIQINDLPEEIKEDGSSNSVRET